MAETPDINKFYLGVSIIMGMCIGTFSSLMVSATFRLIDEKNFINILIYIITIIILILYTRHIYRKFVLPNIPGNKNGD